MWKREWYADGTQFVGQDGEGVEGKGSRAVRDGTSNPAAPLATVAGEGVWKENFPVVD